MKKKVLFSKLKIKKIHVCMWDYEIKAIDEARRLAGFKNRSEYISIVMMRHCKRIINKDRFKKFLFENSEVEEFE